MFESSFKKGLLVILLDKGTKENELGKLFANCHTMNEK